MTQKRRKADSGKVIGETTALRWEPTHVTKPNPRVVPLQWGSGGDSFGQCGGGGARYGLKGLIGQMRLVNPPRCSIPRVGIGIGWSSVGHSGDLVLNS